MKDWWKKVVGYQIYIRSFKDSNNDGIGDLLGIYEKLDYLSYLGINLIWICPFYDSPMDDNGYDVRDFFKVSADYGTLDDFKKLLSKAHSLNIKVMMDLVLNHTSDEHPWFKEARKSVDNPYHDYYIWGKPRYIDNKKVEPTNWMSFFGGSCFEYNGATDEYYMKIFSKKMPDLNWKNPKVIEEIAKVIDFWCNLGVDGFRVDAVAHLGKSDFIDSKMDTNDYYKPDYGKFSNLSVVHEYLHRLNEIAFSKYNIVTVGEVGGCALIEDAIKYSSPYTKELNMVFNFDHNWCNNGWDKKDDEELVLNGRHLKEMFNKWQTGMYNKGWNAIYWLNHDQPRVATHYGCKEYQLLSEKMLCTILYFMSGTPFIYNGEEIGMTNPTFKSINDFKDVSIHNQYKKDVLENHQSELDFIKKVSYNTRDNARTIMQWDDSKYAGFSDVTPWNIINDNYIDINVAKELKDDNSLLEFYRKVINIRLRSIYSDIICLGDYQMLYIDDPDLYIYERNLDGKTLLVVSNLTKKEVKLPLLPYIIKDTLITNYHNNLITEFNYQMLRPFESYVFIVERK